MIQLTTQQLSALVELANRAPKSVAETLALETIVNDANQQIDTQAANAPRIEEQQ